MYVMLVRQRRRRRRRRRRENNNNNNNNNNNKIKSNSEKWNLNITLMKPRMRVNNTRFLSFVCVG